MVRKLAARVRQGFNRLKVPILSRRILVDLGWMGWGVGLFLLIGLNGVAIGGTGLSEPTITPPLQVASAGQPSLEQFLQQGKNFYQVGQFAAAVQVWERALQADAIRDQPLAQAMIWNYLTLAYQQLGQWQPASRAIAQSLKLLQANPNRATAILAQTLNNQGRLQLAQGNAQEALVSWQQATALYTQAGNLAGRIGSLVNQAQAQQSLGLYLQARKTLEQVEQLIRQQSDTRLKATALRSLGNVLRLTGNLSDSRRVLAQGLIVVQAQDDGAETAAMLLSLGNTARAQRDSNAAIAFYREAMAQTTVSLVRVQVQLNQVSLLGEENRWSEAVPLLPTLQTQLADLPPSRASINAHINLAQSLMQFGTTRTTAALQDPMVIAASLLARASQQAVQIGDRRAESYALGYLGSLYTQTRQWQEARSLTQEALVLAQTVNAPDITYRWQWQLGRILNAQGNKPAAIAAYQVAFQTLQPLRKDLVAINPDIQFSFRESVEPVYREYVDLLLQPTQAGAPSPANLQQARAVIESLQLAELDNFFRSACLEGQIVGVEQVQQGAAAVIYPIILADRLAVILSLPNQPLRYYAALVSATTVETVLDQLRQNLEQPYTSPEGKQLGQRVYDWLIRPVAAELTQSQVQTLVFVLDGSLRNVPMAALYDGQQYLIEQYSVALTPGLQLLGPKPLRQSELKTLALGLSESRDGFSALPNVEQEMAAIRAKLPSTVLLNQAFTSSALESQIEAEPYAIVHLATHGQFSSNVDETFVLAWDKRINVNELKTLLQTTDRQRSEAIELLVLSACQTAAGDDRAALGLAGVAVQAGARSTLASLWSLDDESGAQVVNAFYRELTARNITKAEALRQAQLTMLRHPDYRHPIYWAPYVLLGNWL